MLIYLLSYRRTGRAGRKGIAYTFLTIDQGLMAGEIIYALEQTNTEIPIQLKVLYNNYVTEQKAVSAECDTGIWNFS